MQLGIFAKTFVRPTLGETLDAVLNHDLDCIQFNFSCVGLPTLPEQIDAALADDIRHKLALRRLTMAAISGTFNLIHPDLQKRRDGLARLKVLIAAARQLWNSNQSHVKVGIKTKPLTPSLSPSEGERVAEDRVRGLSSSWQEDQSKFSPIITLCTGTRDAEDMWRRHPDNDSSEAWRDLLRSLGEVLPVAEANGVTLAFEPEVANVVDSARKGRRLLDELKSSQLKVVMDAANLFHGGELPRRKDILNEAFDLLGKDIVIAHAKDLSGDGTHPDTAPDGARPVPGRSARIAKRSLETSGILSQADVLRARDRPRSGAVSGCAHRDGQMRSVAAGKGLLDYDLYISLLDGVGFSGPLILHGLEEDEVPECVAFLRGKMEITG